MVTTVWYRQGALRRTCSWCDGHGRMTMGWPENVSWDENAYPCSHCGGRGWVADARTVPRTSRRRIRPQESLVDSDEAAVPAPHCGGAVRVSSYQD